MHLAQHRAALGLHLGRRYQQPLHPVGLDPQCQIEMLGRQGLEIGRLIEPGVAVPFAADRVDRAHELGVWEVFAGAKGHVLEKVGEAGAPDVFIAGADTVEHLHADHRRGRHLEDDQREAVVEMKALRPGEVERGERGCSEIEERQRTEYFFQSAGRRTDSVSCRVVDHGYSSIARLLTRSLRRGRCSRSCVRCRGHRRASETDLFFQKDQMQ